MDTHTKTDDSDIGDHLIEEMDWWGESKQSSAFWVAAILVGLPIVVLLLLSSFNWDISGKAVPLGLATGFVVLEALLGLRGLAWLKKTGLEEAEMLHQQLQELANGEGRKNVSTRAHSALESSVETIDSSYQTISNAIIVFGMVGSAGFLLVNVDLNTSNFDSILSIAPKAFSATGYAIWCGLAVGLAGMVKRIDYRASALKYISAILDKRDLGKNDEVAQLERLANGVVQFTNVMGTLQDSGLPGAMKKIQGQLPKLVSKQDELLTELKALNTALTGEDGVKQGLTTASAALKVVNETGRAEELSTIAQHLPELSKSQKDSATHLQTLATALQEDGQALLERHLADLTKVTTDLANQAFENSNDKTQQHLNSVNAQVEKVVTEAYTAAFGVAQKTMLEDLQSANTELVKSSENMKSIKNDFSEVNQSLALLHNTMATNTATVQQRAEAYGTAAALVAQRVIELTDALTQLGGAGNHQALDQIVSALAEASSSLTSASQNLTATQRAVEQNIADVRTELTNSLPSFQ